MDLPIYIKCPEEASPERRNTACWAPGAGGTGSGGGDGLVAMEFHVGATDTFWDQTDMVAGDHRIVHIKMLNFMYVGFTTNFFFF